MPTGFEEFERVEFDFNHDRQKDVVITLTEGKDSMQPRPVLVLLGQKRGGYALHASVYGLAPELGEMGARNWSRHALERQGDKLLVVWHSHTNDWSNTVTYTFRFLGKRMYLAGKTIERNLLSSPLECVQGNKRACDWESTLISVDLRSGALIESWRCLEGSRIRKVRWFKRHLNGKSPIGFASFEKDKEESELETLLANSRDRRVELCR